ncbi:L-type lectin-domain containing receptor kinase IX.1-like protein [Tanacetum coccineum]
MFLIPTTLCLMFNMSEIGPENQKDIITDGVGTYLSTDGIELTTRNRTRAGKATYVELLHLWDADSGQLADFTTHFSGSIDSRNGSDRLMSFFLARNGSQLVPFVAVEFDTRSNSNWDPVDGRDHVGINVNSSVEFEKWGSNVSFGNQYFMKIQYDSGSQNLSVFYRGTIVKNQFELHQTVDLRNVLPERVVFGFSSSSSSGNSVKSWCFNSTILHMDKKRLKKKLKKKRASRFNGRVKYLVLISSIIGGFFVKKCWRKKTGANDQTIADGGPISATINSPSSSD